MIHSLEDCKVEIPDPTYQSLLKEAVKCYYNDIASYFNDNKIKRNDDFYGNIHFYGVKYHNYSFFPDGINYKYIFLYICKFNYKSLVKLYIKYGKVDLNYMNSYCFARCSSLRRIPISSFFFN